MLGEEEYVASCGEISATEDATEETKNICEEVRPSAEGTTGKSYEVFTAKSQANQQTSFGTYLYIQVQVGADDFLHLRVFKGPDGECVDLDGVLEGKKVADKLECFDATKNIMYDEDDYVPGDDDP
ncbi:cystatin-B-like [Genypterus blacodes]|uniref:cystatin-B-like n=1 Tax=Genypterus blacodes TaxID=154954 RepID=UPI003F7665A2